MILIICSSKFHILLKKNSNLQYDTVTLIDCDRYLAIVQQYYFVYEFTRSVRLIDKVMPAGIPNQDYKAMI